VPPEQRVRLFSHGQWESFVEEWVDSLRDEYVLVERCGGAGDMGRDVIANVKDGNGAWDNYQCKHYQNALTPGDVWVEMGKLAYYTLKREYSCPRKYFFVAPHGVGPALSNLLKKPHALRDGLLDNWDKKCRMQITKTEVVECDAAMKTQIENIDFSIFQTKPLLRIIEGHAKTPWHVARFGGGLPARPEPMLPPSMPANNEAVFIGEIRRAYADHLKLEVKDLDSGLVSRDDLRGAHADGYGRVVAVVKTARMLQLTGNPHATRIHIRDRGGICHQLANDGKVRWVK